MNFTPTQPCSFSDDLLSYLYGEISPAKSRSFETHLKLCGTCQSEFSEFTSVRDAVGLWRDEILAVAPSSQTAVRNVGPIPAERPSNKSAVAAFREFFSLSPVWLRGATAVAALAIFALLVFTVWEVSSPDRVIVHEVVKSSPSPIVEEQAPVEDNNTPAESVGQTAKLEVGTGESTPPRFVNKTPDNRLGAFRRQNSARVPRTRKQFNDGEYAVLDDAKNRQILSDLGLVSSRDDEMAPRLSDLIVEPESNN